MIKSLTKITFIWLAFFFSSLALASYEAELKQLKSYLSDKQYIQAYDYSETLADDLAGEFAFDFMAGIAAFGAEKYQAAVFAFERVVIHDPMSYTGRYYLALSYKAVDNLHGAIVEFETLLTTRSTGSSLTDEQKANVVNQLKSVNRILSERKRRWSHEILFGVGSDNNINSGSSEDEIALPDGTLIPLFDSSKATSDGTYQARYALKYQQPLSQNQKLLFDFAVQNKHYVSHHEYNRQMLSVSIKYEQQLQENSTWYLGASTAPLWFSSEKYRTQNALNFGWQQAINTASNYGVNGLVADVKHNIYSDLDFERYQMNAFYRMQAKYQHMFLLNWYQDKNQKGFDHNSRMAVGISYIVSYPIYQNFTGNTLIKLEKQNYDEPNPLFGVYSDSVLSVVSTELAYTGFENQIIQLQLSYQDKRLDSEISAMKIYEYDRFEANLTWKYAF
ncbi:DUF560 domain-containing protein [Colwellia sp. BRX10-3]|uniref:surface lipoprotein assembly modifier n=1 Tax=Colwellia sp. BRX10-3 TaxID=2759844 RepID=UPI0015F56EE0|nr:surface lipoprotein assembly modifier [Colwellia sp. BRX10-3]MBA6391506.1 DUF560 domain-containing protein [Colwellia sp. BRX10-3]